MHQPAARAVVVAQRAVHDAARGTAHARGYDRRWAALSRQVRMRFPFSVGYLTRTALWTHNLAAQFHALRVAAAEVGRWGAFFEPGGPGTRYLEQFPIYELHRDDRHMAVDVVDHIIPHGGNPALFWAEWNLQALSKRQHDEKTATHDGGFGHGGPVARPAPAAAVVRSGPEDFLA